MPIFVKTIPQQVDSFPAITMSKLLEVLPDKLPYDRNVWIGGKLALYGITCDNLIFYVGQDETPDSEMMQYFNKVVSPLGLQATASSSWKTLERFSIRLYNNGRLIIDRKTGLFIETPSVCNQLPILFIDDFIASLPKTIPWKETVYFVGGLQKNGWSAHDADVMVLDPDFPNDQLRPLANYIAEYTKCRVDCGKRFMAEREPIYATELYINGELQDGAFDAKTWTPILENLRKLTKQWQQL